MRMPEIRGVIGRRVLVNYRVAPERLAAVLPPPFRPKLHRGWGVAGVCLIRLERVRPAWAPRWVGIASENAAHRVAVQWDEQGQIRQGVYIPRRDTSSLLNHLVGGRLFPGVHHRAHFTVTDEVDHCSVAVRSSDGDTRIEVAGRIAHALPTDSIFADLGESSSFFEAGSLGFSVTARPGRFDGLELHCDTWRVQPLAVERVSSSFFDDRERFGPGEAVFDHALLMRNVNHTWRAREPLCCETGCATDGRKPVACQTPH
jgi:hypothetical protein